MSKEEIEMVEQMQYANSKLKQARESIHILLISERVQDEESRKELLVVDSLLTNAFIGYELTTKQLKKERHE